MSESVEETTVLTEVHLEQEKHEEEVKGKLLEAEHAPEVEAPTTSGQYNPNVDPVTQHTTTSEEDAGGCALVLKVFSCIFLVMFFPFSLFCALQMVQEYERAVIFRLGRIIDGGAKGPGLFFTYPCVDTAIKVDLRTKSVDIRPQEILTKDHVTVSVDAVMYTRIVDPVLSITKVENIDGAARLLGATTLRNVLGTYKMTDILAERDSINQMMKEMLDTATDPWGLVIERVEITDVSLPDNMKRAMAAEAEATREAKAKVIAAEGENRASHALKEAADVMSGSPAAMQLRYLQTLNTISAEKNSTIIFPLPMEFLQTFSNVLKPPQSAI